MLLGKILVLLRKRKGYTGQQVADALHVSRSTYSRYENNLLKVEPDVLESLASFYETTAEDFIIWYGFSKEASFPYNAIQAMQEMDN